MDQDVLQLFSPQTAAWFRAAFGGPTDVQKEAWPAIMYFVLSMIRLIPERL